ncbi:MAG: hypothetical protein V3U54_13425 [Thermodesulfobacteriota bacterium]
MKLSGDCPNCKKPISFDVDKLDPKSVKVPELENASVTGQQTQQIEKPPEIKEPKPKPKTVIENFKPNHECPDGNCDIGIHKNTNYTKIVKGQCENCKQFTRYDTGTCPWCKKDEIEPVDPEELDDLGIAKPPEQVHEEHEHE